ncbi:MAG: ABC transporter permease [Anaerolineae bacterium]|nr:ABC transporter permease [Anaerolineae bacterium]
MLEEKPKSLPDEGFNFPRFLRKNALQLGIFGVLLALWIIFIAAAPGTFLSANIYKALMATVPFFGIVALPMTMLVIAGDIDLSFTSTMAVGVVAFVAVFTATNNVWLAFVACLASGFIVGLINGFIVVGIGIPSLIATIGTQFFWRGVVLVARDGKSAVLVEPKATALGDILVGRLFDAIPMQMIWFVVIGIAVWLLLNRHRFGAHVYLTGDNVNSARLMGIRVGFTRVMLFALVGTAAAFAGLIASLHVANFFTTLGEGHLLTTLASVFLGGTSVFGGVGTVVGTFIATFIIASIQPAIVAIGLTGFWTQLIYGLIITLSVAMHTIIRKRFS